MLVNLQSHANSQSQPDRCAPLGRLPFFKPSQLQGSEDVKFLPRYTPQAFHGLIVRGDQRMEVMQSLEFFNLECPKISNINTTVPGNLKALGCPLWSQCTQGFQVTCVESRNVHRVSTELPRFSACWLHGKKAMGNWHESTALEL